MKRNNPTDLNLSHLGIDTNGGGPTNFTIQIFHTGLSVIIPLFLFALHKVVLKYLADSSEKRSIDAGPILGQIGDGELVSRGTRMVSSNLR